MVGNGREMDYVILRIILRLRGEKQASNICAQFVMPIKSIPQTKKTILFFPQAVHHLKLKTLILSLFI